MTGNLTLNKTKCTCTSTWKASLSPGGSRVIYTDPTTDYDNAIISVPAELQGASFSAVHLSYSQSSNNGSASIKFSDTRETYSDAKLLARLQAGETSISLLFSYKAAGGTGNVGSHSSTKTWSSLAASVTYQPASGASINVDGAFTKAQAYFNDDGTWTQCQVYINDNGQWVQAN